MNVIDSQAVRKFLHSKKEPSAYARRFEFFRKQDDLHLLVEQDSQPGTQAPEMKPEDLPSMDATILRKDKEMTILTVAAKRSGDIVIEARILQSK